MQKVLAGNWKMFKTRQETRDFFKVIGTQIHASKVRKIIAPSPTLMETALAAAAGSGIEIFAQNVAWAESGAFTGEMSPTQLLDLGIRGTLVAHSERRQYFGETDATAVKRAALALTKGLHVIYCIGEKIDERQAGHTMRVLETQLAPVIQELLPKVTAPGSFMLAYEPVWAIGTGLVATPEQVEEAHRFIAERIRVPLPILYGGSVKADNLASLAALKSVDGALVGGASLDAKTYLELHGILDKAPAGRV